MICKGLSRKQANELYIEILEADDREALRQLTREDLFFLMTTACKRKDMDRDWLYDRCREVEANPDGYLDLWAREHYKSTIITFGKSLQDILINPEITIGIFSHTRPIAKGFLDQIKRELETNDFLKEYFDDVLYEKPESQSERWSLDSGLIVKRSTNPKEATLEAWGLVDGQPTSKHFSLLVYDDVVTRESVTTPEQIKKVTEAWELSINLGAEGGRKRYIGTRYHANDTYRIMMERGSVIKRIHTATDTGKLEGNPVLLSKDSLMQKRRDMGPYTFGSQMLQDPVADKAMGFREEWLKFTNGVPEHNGWNIYLLVDPASKRKKTNDYTVMEVIGLAPDNNYYLLDAIRDRLNLTKRTDKVFELHEKWQPSVVGYEQYGMQSDIEHIQFVMEQRNYRFNIIEVGGQMPKEDRIQRLIPIYEQGRFYMPKQLIYIDSEGRVRDYVKLFIEDEFLSFPVSTHDDMLDCRSRIVDPTLGAKFPKIQKKTQTQDDSFAGPQSWMS